MKKMDKRIKLEEEITPKANFTHSCALCLAWLFSDDIYCPRCGTKVSNVDVIIAKVKAAKTSDDDYNKPMEEPV